MRRARRIDDWKDHDPGLAMIDPAFQDSCGDPGMGLIAVHEYSLRASDESAERSRQPFGVSERGAAQLGEALTLLGR